MIIVEYIKTLFLEYKFIKEHIVKKTNERIIRKKISNMKFEVDPVTKTFKQKITCCKKQQ
jgi:hypothetical protein